MPRRPIPLQYPVRLWVLQGTALGLDAVAYLIHPCITPCCLPLHYDAWVPHNRRRRANPTTPAVKGQVPKMYIGGILVTCV